MSIAEFIFTGYPYREPDQKREYVHEYQLQGNWKRVLELNPANPEEKRRLERIQRVVESHTVKLLQSALPREQAFNLNTLGHTVYSIEPQSELKYQMEFESQFYLMVGFPASGKSTVLKDLERTLPILNEKSYLMITNLLNTVDVKVRADNVREFFVNGELLFTTEALYRHVDDQDLKTTEDLLAFSYLVILRELQMSYLLRNIYSKNDGGNMNYPMIHQLSLLQSMIRVWSSMQKSEMGDEVLDMIFRITGLPKMFIWANPEHSSRLAWLAELQKKADDGDAEAEKELAKREESFKVRNQYDGLLSESFMFYKRLLTESGFDGIAYELKTDMKTDVEQFKDDLAESLPSDMRTNIKAKFDSELHLAGNRYMYRGALPNIDESLNEYLVKYFVQFLAMARVVPDLLDKNDFTDEMISKGIRRCLNATFFLICENILQDNSVSYEDKERLKFQLTSLREDSDYLSMFSIAREYLESYTGDNKVLIYNKKSFLVIFTELVQLGEEVYPNGCDFLNLVSSELEEAEVSSYKRIVEMHDLDQEFGGVFDEIEQMFINLESDPKNTEKIDELKDWLDEAGLRELFMPIFIQGSVWGGHERAFDRIRWNAFIINSKPLNQFAKHCNLKDYRDLSYRFRGQEMPTAGAIESDMYLAIVSLENVIDRIDKSIDESIDDSRSRLLKYLRWRLGKMINRFVAYEKAVSQRISHRMTEDDFYSY